MLAIKKEVRLYHHKTYEIVHIVKDKCDLIITMNVTYSLAKALCDKNKTVLYFVSCSKDPVALVKERYFIATSHLKLYRTDAKVFISTANLSLSAWDELTIEIERDKELDTFVDKLLHKLKLRNDFITAFH